ncbi:MAG: GNAT family N-acetyltransferase [Erysipelotrichaceae bacterium]
MLKNKKVTCKDLKRMDGLLKRDFLESERLPTSLLFLLSKRKGVKWLQFYDNDQFVGFCYLFLEGSHGYVLYLDVDLPMRSNGYGQRILAWLQAHFAHTTFYLHIQEVNERFANVEERRKRKAFYLRNGYHESGYHEYFNGEPNELLTSASAFSLVDYQALFKKASFGLYVPHPFVARERKR